MRLFIQDIRYGLRMLARNPGFAAVAVIALALGIGANTAIFSVVDGVLLQPLPYLHPDRLMQLRETSPEFARMAVSYPNFVDWKDQSHSFAGLAAYRWADYDVTGGRQPEHLSGKMVSADFFPVLGISPVLGRDFDSRTDRLGASPVVLIGGGLWSRRFGSNPTVLGNQLTLNGRSYTIVGVVPADFQLEGQADIYTPLEQWDDLLARAREMHPGMSAVGRLKPGVSETQAQSEMTAIAAHLAEVYPKANSKHGVDIAPLTSVIVGDTRPTLLVLLGAVGFVLLIACANVANLLLARFTRRRKEIAIRVAMGAGRGRVIRQLLTESVLLALAGGVAGLTIAPWCTQAVLAAVPGGLPRMENIGVDGWVLAFALGVSLLTGIVFGLAPALHASVTELHESLQEGSRGSSSGPRRLHNLLVVSEVAAALVLLAGAGLMLRTIWSLHGAHPGFDSGHVLTFSIGLSPANTSSSDRILQNFEQSVDRIQAVPGVKSAAVTSSIPLVESDTEIPFYVNGRPRPTSQGDMLWSLLYATSPGYLRAMRIPLLRGRYIELVDMHRGSHVAVIDEVLARTVFPHEDPLGKRIAVADVGGDLGHVQRAGAAVDERDPGQRQVGADAVGDGEVERALDGAALFWPVGGQRVGGHAHQLEPHEQVEDVPGQAEPGHAREEGQHQDVEVAAGLGEVPPGEHQRRGHQHRAEAGQPGAQRAGLEVDPDHDAARGPETGEPVGGVGTIRSDDEETEHDGDGCRDRDRDQIGDPPMSREQRTGGEQRGGGQQRHRHHQGVELVHQPLNSASSAGSRVPKRFCAWIAKDSSSAVTAASTTTSVRAHACTMGSTAGVWFGTSK